ncbi:MAG: site-specific DNA-methyltransferase, partial [Planctomycetaceae bacterium]|nr:site-specific DNA-methyltransferase [Planctomycetaceae bacterium]
GKIGSIKNYGKVNKEMRKVKIGNCTLYHGDSYSILPKLNIKADAIISDPPYGITHCEWDEGLILPMFWDLVNNTIKPSANIVLFAASRFMIDLVNSKYRWFRYDLVWAKNNKVGFFNANKQPLRSHEHILVFGREGEKANATYNPVKIGNGNPYKKKHIHKAGVYPARSYYTESDGNRHPCSVLHYKSDKDKYDSIHPTLKPVALMEFLVASYSNENDIVIDPFMGAGTTGVACQKLGRKFIGIEREKQYFETTVKRLKES